MHNDDLKKKNCGSFCKHMRVGNFVATAAFVTVAKELALRQKRTRKLKLRKKFRNLAENMKFLIVYINYIITRDVLRN